MFDNLNTIKDEIRSVDKKVGNDLNLIRNTLYESIMPQLFQPSSLNQVIHEEQKVSNDDSLSSQNMNSAYDNESSKIHDQEQINSFKEKVESIKMIVSKETRDIPGLLNSFDRNHTASEYLIQYSSSNKQNLIQDGQLNLEMSNAQNRPYAQNHVKDDIQNAYMMHNKVNEFEDSKINGQNQNEEEK